ncbi:Fur family transcriptional regulator [Nocardioides ferulae]|uniref:Fur family transcriptional regulator n=1 Tax=Nocardioides ferulae TaxID=2340821 RepID=UPI000EAF6048|nr:Fur family transcriptional regulator [Nocardioides ferulae]
MADDLRARLRGKGFRLTPQRQLILDAVERLGHGTAEDVLAEVQQQVSAVNQSTVYRNLDVLEQLGLVRHIHLTGKAPTYHSTSGPQHFHLTCRNCRCVISVDQDVAAEFTARLRAEHGFVVDVGHLTVFGHCESCDRSDPPEDPHAQPESPA